MVDGRLLVANLDYEDPRLPRRVRRAASVAGTLMAVLGRDGDRLWTPEPVVAPALEGLPAVELVTGDMPGANEVLAWAESDRVAMRRMGKRDKCAKDAHWIDRLWAVKPPEPAVVTRVNHRRFCFELARDRGVLLPGARIVDDVADLDALDAPHWVLKAPMAASGRMQLRRRGRLDAALLTRATRLLARFGELYYEPWMERTADFGVAGLIDDHGVLILPPHRLDTDDQGVFRSIDTSVACPYAAVLRDTADAVATALSDAGYRGPFGIDAFEHTDGFAPLCEINARLTFGHLAHAGVTPAQFAAVFADNAVFPRKRPPR